MLKILMVVRFTRERKFNVSFEHQLAETGLKYSSKKVAEENTRLIFILLFVICAASITDVLERY